MKKLALAALIAALPMAALAAAPDATAPAVAPSTVGAPPVDTAAPAGGPAALGAKVEATKSELADGSWAQVSPDGSVKISKDGGLTWAPAGDGTYTDKTGNNIVVTGGFVKK